METTEPQNLSVEEVAERLTARSEESEQDQELAPDNPTDEDQDEDETLEAEASDDVEAEDADEADADEETDEDDSDEELAETYTVKVNGEEKQVTLEEALRGYSGQAYVQQGMEQNANRAKELEQREMQAQQVLTAVSQMYQQAQATGFVPAPQPPDPSMRQEDEFGYSLAWTDYLEKKQAWESQETQRQQLEQAQTYYAEQQRQAHLAQQRDALVEKFPELKTPDGAERFQARLKTGAKEFYGLSDDALNGVTDAWAAEILNDAISYRELQKAKPATRKKVESARQVVKPKGGKSPKAAKAKKVDALRARVRRNGGSVDDIAALMEAKG